MLQIKSTVNNTGITVTGSYDDLSALHDSLVGVVGGKDDFFYQAASRQRVLGVCHEIRQAFVLLSRAKMLYVSRLPEDIRKEAQPVLHNHIALIHYFQDLIWNELERIVGDRRVMTIFGEYNDLRSMHFKFPQLDGFHTQWLDLLNVVYLCSKPEQRSSHLVTILTKLFSIDEEYLALKNSIDVFAEQEGIRVTGVRIADCVYPDKIEW